MAEEQGSKPTGSTSSAGKGEWRGHCITYFVLRHGRLGNINFDGGVLNADLRLVRPCRRVAEPASLGRSGTKGTTGPPTEGYAQLFSAIHV